MSTLSGIGNKGEKSKGKFTSFNINNLYKGTAAPTQKSAVSNRQHGLQSLGKVPSARRMPPPAQLPSLKSENSGNDPTISLVPTGGAGWGTKDEPPTSRKDTPPTQPSSQPQQATPPSSQQGQSTAPSKPVPASSASTTAAAPPGQAGAAATATINTATTTTAAAAATTAGPKSWSSVTMGRKQQGGVLDQKSPYFAEEFPKLDTGAEESSPPQMKEEALPKPQYGPGPSLRPQNVGNWKDGGGVRMQPQMTSQDNATNGQPASQTDHDGTSPTGGGQRPAAAHPPGPMGPGAPIMMPPPHMRGMMPPPYAVYGRGGFPPYPPNYMQRPPYPPYTGDVRFRGAPPPPQPPVRKEAADDAYRPPAIIKDKDLKDFDDIIRNDERDGGWAGATGEIDYTEKLVFSDDEDDAPAPEPSRKSDDYSRDGRDSREKEKGRDWDADRRAPDRDREPRETYGAHQAHYGRSGPTPPVDGRHWHRGPYEPGMRGPMPPFPQYPRGVRAPYVGPGRAPDADDDGLRVARRRHNEQANAALERGRIKRGEDDSRSDKWEDDYKDGEGDCRERSRTASEGSDKRPESRGGSGGPYGGSKLPPRFQKQQSGGSSGSSTPQPPAMRSAPPHWAPYPTDPRAWMQWMGPGRPPMEMPPAWDEQMRRAGPGSQPYYDHRYGPEYERSDYSREYERPPHYDRHEYEDRRSSERKSVSQEKVRERKDSRDSRHSESDSAKRYDDEMERGRRDRDDHGGRRDEVPREEGRRNLGSRRDWNKSREDSRDERPGRQEDRRQHDKHNDHRHDARTRDDRRGDRRDDYDHRREDRDHKGERREGGKSEDRRRDDEHQDNKGGREDRRERRPTGERPDRRHDYESNLEGTHRKEDRKDDDLQKPSKQERDRPDDRSEGKTHSEKKKEVPLPFSNQSLQETERRKRDFTVLGKQSKGDHASATKNEIKSLLAEDILRPKSMSSKSDKHKSDRHEDSKADRMEEGEERPEKSAREEKSGQGREERGKKDSRSRQDGRGKDRGDDGRTRRGNETQRNTGANVWSESAADTGTKAWEGSQSTGAQWDNQTSGKKWEDEPEVTAPKSGQKEERAWAEQNQHDWGVDSSEARPRERAPRGRGTREFVRGRGAARGRGVFSNVRGRGRGRGDRYERGRHGDSMRHQKDAEDDEYEDEENVVEHNQRKPPKENRRRKLDDHDTVEPKQLAMDLEDKARYRQSDKSGHKTRDKGPKKLSNVTKQSSVDSNEDKPTRTKDGRDINNPWTKFGVVEQPEGDAAPTGEEVPSEKTDDQVAGKPQETTKQEGTTESVTEVADNKDIDATVKVDGNLPADKPRPDRQRGERPERPERGRGRGRGDGRGRGHERGKGRAQGTMRGEGRGRGGDRSMNSQSRHDKHERRSEDKERPEEYRERREERRENPRRDDHRRDDRRDDRRQDDRRQDDRRADSRGRGRGGMSAGRGSRGRGRSAPGAEPSSRGGRHGHEQGAGAGDAQADGDPLNDIGHWTDRNAPPRFRGGSGSRGRGAGRGGRGAIRTQRPRSPASQKAHSPVEPGQNNSSDHGAEEWETASENSDHLEKSFPKNDMARAAGSPTSGAPRNEQAKKKSFTSQRPERNKRSESKEKSPGAQANGSAVGAGGPQSDSAPRGPGGRRDGRPPQNPTQYVYRAEQQAMDPAVLQNAINSINNKNKTPKGKENLDNKIVKPTEKKPDALANIDINNIASVVVIDDQPEVSIDDPAFLFENNEGFQEVTSKKDKKLKHKVGDGSSTPGKKGSPEPGEEPKKKTKKDAEMPDDKKKAKKPRVTSAHRKQDVGQVGSKSEDSLNISKRGSEAKRLSKLPPRLAKQREKDSLKQEKPLMQEASESSSAEILPKIGAWDNTLANDIPPSFGAAPGQKEASAGLPGHVGAGSFSLNMPVPAPAPAVNAWDKPISLSAHAAGAGPVKGAQDQHDSGIDISEAPNSASSSTRSSPNADGKIHKADGADGKSRGKMRLTDKSAVIRGEDMLRKEKVKSLPQAHGIEPIQLPASFKDPFKIGKGDESSDIKLDFTFDADLEKITEEKAVPKSMPSKLVSNALGPVSVTSPTSPATEDLNQKIAKVKNVWEALPSMPTVFEHSDYNRPGSDPPLPNSNASVVSVKQAMDAVGPSAPYGHQNQFSFSDNLHSQGGGIASLGAAMRTSPLHSYTEDASQVSAANLGRVKGSEQPNVCKVRPQQQISSSMGSSAVLGLSGVNSPTLPSFSSSSGHGVPSPPTQQVIIAPQVSQYQQFPLGASQLMTTDNRYGFGLGQQAGPAPAVQPVQPAFTQVTNLFLQTPAAQTPSDVYGNSAGQLGYRAPSFAPSVTQQQSTIMVSSANTSLMSAAVKPPSQASYLSGSTTKASNPLAMQYGAFNSSTLGPSQMFALQYDAIPAATTPQAQTLGSSFGSGSLPGHRSQGPVQSLGVGGSGQSSFYSQQPPPPNPQPPLQQTGFYQAQQQASSLGSNLSSMTSLQPTLQQLSGSHNQYSMLSGFVSQPSSLNLGALLQQPVPSQPQTVQTLTQTQIGSSNLNKSAVPFKPAQHTTNQFDAGFGTFSMKSPQGGTASYSGQSSSGMGMKSSQGYQPQQPQQPFGFMGSLGAMLQQAPTQQSGMTSKPPAKPPTQGGVFQPGSSQGGVFQPGSSQGGVFQPGSSQGGVFQPGSSQGGVFQPGSSQGGVFQPGSSHASNMPQNTTFGANTSTGGPPFSQGAVTRPTAPHQANVNLKNMPGPSPRFSSVTQQRGNFQRKYTAPPAGGMPNSASFKAQQAKQRQELLQATQAFLNPENKQKRVSAASTSAATVTSAITSFLATSCDLTAPSLVTMATSTMLQGAIVSSAVTSAVATGPGSIVMSDVTAGDISSVADAMSSVIGLLNSGGVPDTFVTSGLMSADTQAPGDAADTLTVSDSAFSTSAATALVDALQSSVSDPLVEAPASLPVSVSGPAEQAGDRPDIPAPEPALASTGEVPTAPVEDCTVAPSSVLSVPTVAVDLSTAESDVQSAEQTPAAPVYADLPSVREATPPAVEEPQSVEGAETAAPETGSETQTAE